MAKKSVVKNAVDEMKNVAGAALAAAAVAATGVVVTRMAGAIRNSGKKLEDSTPEIQKLAGDTVSKPLLPSPKKRAAAKRATTTAKRKVAAKKATKKRARKKR
jgi:hypothetical protein